MTRRSLGEEARGRFADAYIEAIRHLGAVAHDQDCSFVAVCGDVFEPNHVGRRTIVRAVEAMADIGLPVVLLPGNHDPLDSACVFDTPGLFAAPLLSGSTSFATTSRSRSHPVSKWWGHPGRINIPVAISSRRCWPASHLPQASCVLHSATAP